MFYCKLIDYYKHIPHTSIQDCDNVFTGHCAKYGSYTMMHLNTNTIVDLQLVQVGRTNEILLFSFSYYKFFQCHTF